MNTEIKRHIDAARQVLVGVVPNPASQIDQITNALIYKFMDDMDQAAMRQGDRAAFFTGDLERYAWTRLMDPKLGSQGKMNLYSEALAKFSQADQLPELFRGIFKSAFLPYRSPEVLDLFLKEINYFDYSHPEELGNAYEYLLSIMSAQGDAGQFRTPRHIIDFMVDVANPTKDDKILDPACGTGGFLVKSYQHILDHFNQKDASGNAPKPITPDERKKLMTNFEGYDIDPTMARIAQVNMYLHQFKNPKIYQYDTLSQQERWGDKFDVILANPPFMSPKGGIRPHSKFSIQSTRSEVLFVDYIMNHLRPKGRAAVIVPEGIIFQSGTAHKQLRKNLLEDGLYCVASLPSGVFAPYSGVKTSILFFDNDLARRAGEILFVKIQNDGFDLGATKRPIAKTDLPQALEIINLWKTGKKSENNLALYVAKSKIAENDYNLSADRYRVAVDYSNAKWPIVKLGEVVIDMKDGGTPSRSKPEYFGGNICWAVVKDIKPLIYDTKEKLTESGLKNSSAKVWPVNSVIISLGATIGNVGIAKVPLATKQGLSGIVVNENKILPKYLYYILVAQKEFIQSQATGVSIKEVRPSKLQEILIIPLPPLEIQEKIVAELDSYQKIIDGAKQIAQNWKPKIEIDPKWEKAKIGDLLKRVNEQIDPQKKFGEIFYVGLENIESNSGLLVGNIIKKYEDIKSIKNVFRFGDILYGKLRPNLNKVWLADRNGICSTDILVFRGTDKVITHFYWYLMLKNDFVDEVMDGIKGAQLPRVGFEYLKEIILPLPSLDIQKQIVEQIEGQRELVEAAKKLIAIYEQKTKDVLAKLWSK